MGQKCMMQILQRMNRLSGKENHLSIEYSISIGIGLLALWFIALMTFMENGTNHIINLALVSGLTIMLVLLARVLSNTKYQGYFIGIVATMIAVIGYFRLNSFFIHTEIAFTLVVIGITARWGAREGFFTALLATMSNSADVSEKRNTPCFWQSFLYHQCQSSFIIFLYMI